jgi:large subunit ribosomal protein L13
LKGKHKPTFSPNYDCGDYVVVVNAKDMNIENADLSTINSDNTTSEIKRIFTKSMKNRLYSRVLLNKFIEQIV